MDMVMFFIKAPEGAKKNRRADGGTTASRFLLYFRIMPEDGEIIGKNNEQKRAAEPGSYRSPARTMGTEVFARREAEYRCRDCRSVHPVHFCVGGLGQLVVPQAGSRAGSGGGCGARGICA